MESRIETQYIKFAKNNVHEIDWNYLILTIKKRLFTMKVDFYFVCVLTPLNNISAIEIEIEISLLTKSGP